MKSIRQFVDYFFRSRLIFSERNVVARPSVCRPCVTLVRRTQPVKIFGDVSTPFGTLVKLIPWHPNFTEIVPGEPLRRGRELNARGVAKYSDFGPIKGYISETVQDRSVSINH